LASLVRKNAHRFSPLDRPSSLRFPWNYSCVTNFLFLGVKIKNIGDELFFASP